MRDILINSTVAATAVGASLVASVASGDSEWFLRSGSIVTVAGLLLMVKHNVLCEGMSLERG
ncbi:hypothetical protein [Arhodomonas sp. SL1]|uniref:hypothetical protein n=1 Tax=Arhodomonas sp. SL1 TaxID=3425691 RepID=UPI003F881E67